MKLNNKKGEEEMIRMVENAARESNRAQKEYVERASFESFLGDKEIELDRTWLSFADNNFSKVLDLYRKAIREAWDKGYEEGARKQALLDAEEIKNAYLDGRIEQVK